MPPIRIARAWDWRVWVVMLIGLDQLTKYCATQALTYGQPLAIFPGFNLTLLHNTGAAFSVLATATGWQRWVLSALGIGASAYIVMLLRSPLTASRRYRVALSLILSGAIGNLIDRLMHGYVVDFIQVYYDRWYWPAFNIADSAISIGAVLVGYEILFGPRASDARADDRCV